MKITKQYLDHNFSWRSKDAKIEWIVIHYTGIAGAQGRAKMVADSLSRASKSDCDSKLKRSASTHYIVGDDGIYQLVRDRHKAWHVGGYSTDNKCGACNDNSLGVDLTEHKRDLLRKSVEDRDWFFSKKVLDDGAALVAELAIKYEIDDSHIIRHFDVTGKWCPRPFVGKDLNVVTGEPHEWAWDLFKRKIDAVRVALRGE